MKDRSGWLYKIFLEGPANNFFQFSIDWVIIALLGYIAIGLLIYFFVKSNAERRQKILRILALVLFVFEIMRITLQFGRYSYESITAEIGEYTSDYDRPSAGLNTLISAISFTFCAFNVWLQIFLIKKNQQKYYQKFGGLTLLLGCFSTLAILLPYGKPNYNIQFFQTVITHFILATVSVLLIIDKKIVPKLREILRVLGQVSLMMLISFFASRLSGSNFMYLKDMTEIFPFLPYIDFPLSVPVLLLLYAALYSVVTGAFLLVATLKKSKESKEDVQNLS